MAPKNNIKEILEDLYALDSSLRAKEKELIPLLEKLIKARPQVRFDKAFAAELKRSLLAKQEPAGQKNNMKNAKSIFSGLDWKIMSYASVGTAALVFVFVAVSSLAILNQKDRKFAAEKNTPASKSQIIKVADKSFGEIILNGSANKESARDSRAVLENSQNSAAMTEPAIPAGLGGGGVSAGKIMSSPSIMPPIFGSIKYVYIGAEFTPPAGQSTVYKKIVNNNSGFAGVISSIKNLNTGEINLNNLSNLKLESLNIKEDREFGYYLGISSGNIFYMSKNWEKWPNPAAKCQDDKCYNDNRIKFSDIPADEELIKIANDFIAEYQINTNGYGEPVVQNSWRTAHEAFVDKENYYLPEEISVVYPILIDGQEVRGQGGELQGLTVNVDVRYRKTSGFNGSLVPNFEASEYETITDTAEIIKLAEAGGLGGVYYFGGVENKEVQIELGTPKLILMQYWQYNQETGQGGDIYVPAYMFPMKNKPADAFIHADNIVVPIVKGVINQVDQPMLLKGVEAPAEAPIELSIPESAVGDVKIQ